MKRLIPLLLVVALAASACGSKKRAATTSSSSFKVGLSTDIGGLNDRSFNHLAYVGLQRVLVRRGVLERVESVRAPGRAGGRPAALFRFASQRLEVTDEFAALRPPR